MSDSTVAQNSAGSLGGGFFGKGTLTGCTVSANTVTVPGATGGGVFGYNSLTLKNCTVSGNSSVGDGGGFEFTYGNHALINCTVVNNVADSDNNGSGNGGGGSASVAGGDSLAIDNTVIANNTDRGGEANDISGKAQVRFSLIEDTPGWTDAGGSGDNLTGVDPALGALQDNGGPTSTHAVAVGSPCLDSGSDALSVAQGFTTDQRGLVRISGVAVDIGAYEMSGPILDLDANDSSGATGNDFLSSFTEEGPAAAIADLDSQITLQAGGVNSAVIVLNNRPDGVLESLSVSGALPGGIAVTDPYDDADGQIVLSGNASAADYQAAIEQFVYTNASENPDATSRSVDVNLFDDSYNGNTARITITINPINDPPTDISLDSTTVNENQSSGTTVGNLSTTDPDG